MYIDYIKTNKQVLARVEKIIFIYIPFQGTTYLVHNSVAHLDNVPIQNSGADFIDEVTNQEIDQI